MQVLLKHHDLAPLQQEGVYQRPFLVQDRLHAQIQGEAAVKTASDQGSADDACFFAFYDRIVVLAHLA